MRKTTQVALLVSFLVGALVSLYASKLTKKNGQTVDGEIQGTLVFRAKGHNAFAFVEGQSILAITADGVRVEQKKVLFVTGLEPKNPPEVIEVGLPYFLKRRDLAKKAVVRDLPSGGQVVGYRQDVGAQETFPLKNPELLGEVRIEEPTGGGPGAISITPEIRVKTAKGDETVPITEIAGSPPGVEAVSGEQIPGALQVPSAPPSRQGEVTGPPPPSAPATKSAGISGDPVQTILFAKSVAVLGQLGEVKMSGRGWLDADPARGKSKVEEALGKWGRFTILDDPAKADLILVVIEGNHLKFGVQGQLYDQLLVFPGGALPSQNSEPLWQGEAKEGFKALPATKVTDKFQNYVTDLEKKPK